MRFIVRNSLFLLLVAGCATPVKYERPPVELPAAWKEAALRFAEDGRWWRIYEDGSLDSLVEESMKTNADLVIAAARVDEARALLGESRSSLFPTVDAQGSASRQRSSRQIATSFAEAAQAYIGNPTALHLRAMNMLFEGLKEKGALVIVPSSAVDTMNLGAMSGMVALAKTAGDEQK